MIYEVPAFNINCSEPYPYTKMKNVYSTTDCYKILNLKSGCSWNEARKSYKALIQKWHPDRFEDNSEKKLAADEKIKTINIAFNQLSAFNRENGRLPIVDSTSNNVTESVKKPERTLKTTEKKQQTRIKDFPVKQRKGKAFTASIVILSLAAAIIFIPENTVFYSDEYQEESSNKSQTDIPKTQKNNHQKSVNSYSTSKNKNFLQDKNMEIIEKNLNNDLKNIEQEEQYFTYGSSLGEVIAIQGAPTKVDGDTWHYGKSKVYFHEGAVVKWKRNANNPLKARLNIE